MKNKTIFPSNLFGSKIRQRLLGLLYTNPGSRYYIRQLANMFDVSVGSLHRELKYLEEIGILKSEREGNLRFYSVDSSYPLFKELKSIIYKTTGVEGSINDALEGIEGIDIAFLYGSFASGKEVEKSDVDLFLIGEFDIDLLNKKLRELERYLSREINYTSMEKVEFQKEKNNRSPFLMNILKEKKIFIIGDEDELQGLS